MLVPWYSTFYAEYRFMHFSCLSSMATLNLNFGININWLKHRKLVDSQENYKLTFSRLKSFHHNRLLVISASVFTKEKFR